MAILSDFGAVFLSTADNVCYDKTHSGCSVRAAIRQNVISESRHAIHGYGVYVCISSA
eukprot:COSAG05_NODE_4409_length_1527_cov_3.513305_2_plen_57_part_01